MAGTVIGMGAMSSCVDQISVGNGFLDKQPGVDVTVDTIFVKGENAKRFLWHMYGAMHNPFTYTGAVWYSHPDALTDICQSYCGWHNLGKYYGGDLTETDQDNGGFVKFPFIANGDGNNRAGIWRTIREGWIFVENIDRVPDLSDSEKSQESGLAIVNMQVKNVPMVFDIEDNYWEKIFIENARFENISGPAFNIAVENNSNNSITLRNVWCSNVPVLAAFKRTGEQTRVSYRKYYVKSFDHGLQMESLVDTPEYKTLLSAEPVDKLPAAVQSVLPALPPMSEWKNLRALGAKGDGVTDDTEAIQKAIDTYDVIYVPSGWYQVSRPIKMRPSTRLIGLHPFSTQFRLGESTPAFSGFGTPVAVLESYKGSDDNILNGIGISTGAFNYRAVGLKWTAGSGSYVNDVKFIGGHGSMWKPVAGQKAPRWSWGPREVSTPDKPVREQGMDQAWDTQYWSLWVTDGGGGIFKDIWTANTYASNGFYAENTSTEGRIYAMSIEHHVRNEVRFRNVSNWKVYCMQTEEETVESSECQPVEMDGCRDITFANLYMFRVIRVVRPYHSAVRLRGCSGIEFLNVHNYAQTKYTTDIAVFDQNKGIEVRPWEFSRLIVKGDEQQTGLTSSDGVRMLAGDFDFTEGIACDSKGAHIRTIHIPERPSTLTIIRDKLYITARKSIYRADL